MGEAFPMACPRMLLSSYWPRGPSVRRVAVTAAVVTASNFALLPLRPNETVPTLFGDGDGGVCGI